MGGDYCGPKIKDKAQHKRMGYATSAKCTQIGTHVKQELTNSHQQVAHWLSVLNALTDINWIWLMGWFKIVHLSPYHCTLLLAKAFEPWGYSTAFPPHAINYLFLVSLAPSDPCFQCAVDTMRVSGSTGASCQSHAWLLHYLQFQLQYLLNRRPRLFGEKEGKLQSGGYETCFKRGLTLRRICGSTGNHKLRWSSTGLDINVSDHVANGIFRLLSKFIFYSCCCRLVYLGINSYCQCCLESY